MLGGDDVREETVFTLPTWTSGLKFPLEADSGQSDHRSSRRCLDTAGCTSKWGRKAGLCGNWLHQ